MPCRIQDTPIDYDMDNADFKIITYIDSAGCTPCKMKLSRWNAVVNEFKAIEGVDVDFLMIVNMPYNLDMRLILSLDNFQHPVSFDVDGLYMQANTIPESDIYRTFLLDADNKIVAVGNPATNPKIRDVYHRIITGNRYENHTLGYSIGESVAVGAVAVGDTIEKRFILTNNRSYAVTIQDMVPSCDCIYVESLKDTLPAGASTGVKVTYVADSTIGAFTRYVDVYYHQQDNPERLTLHGYIY